MKVLQIAVVCTFGAGSSMLLKLNLENVFSQMGILANIEVDDLSSVKGKHLDMIFSSSALYDQISETIEDKSIKIIPVKNYFDLKGLEKLAKENINI